MATVLNPYIHFDGTAAEAMKFYQSVLGGELETNTYGATGYNDPAVANKIMHATLRADGGLQVMAADIPPGMDHESGAGVAISLSGDDADRLRGHWEKLSAGGKVQVPMEKQVWGDEFGQCVDKFGVTWLVNIVQSA